ncbi:regulatory protein [Citrobacter freundii]|nr:regulatory protein [Citrobacter freundii]
MLRTTMLKNPMIWLLGVSYVLVYLIRIALNDWGQYLADGKPRCEPAQRQCHGNAV